MAYTTAEGRQQILDELARATDELGYAFAALGEAYEQVDEQTGDRLEEQLYRPVQGAYGRARRTYADFAQRTGMPSRTFEPQATGLPSGGPRSFIDAAVEAVGAADAILAELQDSMLPVEVGDPELRASLADVREHASDISRRARELVRTLGR
jgi:hypothetical protein